MYKTSLLTFVTGLCMLSAPFLATAQTAPVSSVQTQIQLLLSRIEALAIGGQEAKHAFDAMMTMQKIDIASIDRARQG